MLTPKVTGSGKHLLAWAAMVSSMGLYRWDRAAEPNPAFKPNSKVLLSRLWKVGRERHFAVCLLEQKATVPSLCFTGRENLFSSCGQSGPRWAVVLPGVQPCVSIQGRCPAQGALRSFMCLSASRALLMCQGRNLPFRASLLWCHCAAASVELSLEDTRIFIPQYLSEKHQYFLSCLDLCQRKGMPVS